MATKLDPVINPIDGEMVSGDVSRYIRKLRRARNGSRKAMRSGNPAKRADAERVNPEIVGAIQDAYRKDYADRNKLDLTAS